MAQLIRFLVTAAACLVLAGCTTSITASPVPTSESPGGTSTTPAPAPSTLTADPIGSEAIALQLASQRQGYEGEIDRTRDRAKVYVRCVGEGTIGIGIDQVAEYKVPCTADGEGELDSFDVRYVERLRVHVESDSDQLWALTITAVALED